MQHGLAFDTVVIWTAAVVGKWKLAPKMWCWKRSKLVLGRISGSPKHAVSAMKSNSHNGRSTLFQPLISRRQQGLYVLTLIITPELCINNCYLQTGTRVKRGSYRAITILFIFYLFLVPLPRVHFLRLVVPGFTSCTRMGVCADSVRPWELRFGSRWIWTMKRKG